MIYIYVATLDYWNCIGGVIVRFVAQTRTIRRMGKWSEASASLYRVLNERCAHGGLTCLYFRDTKGKAASSFYLCRLVTLFRLFAFTICPIGRSVNGKHFEMNISRIINSKQRIYFLSCVCTTFFLPYLSS